MDTQAIRAQMRTLVVGHVPSNVRSFKFNIFDGEPKVSTLGFHIDPKPFEGRVIATTDEAIVVKTGRAEFAVLDRSLVTEVPDEGAKVQVEPYVRRRFDGQRADTPEEHTEFTADGKPYTGAAVRARFRAGEAADPRTPLPRGASAYPADGRVASSRRFPAYHPFAGGCRRAGLYLDRSAAQGHHRDAADHRLHGGHGKVPGRVAVQYKRGLDLYAVELHRDRELVERVDEVFFDALGETLERLIDDGSWRRIPRALPVRSQVCPALTPRSLPLTRREVPHSAGWRHIHICSIRGRRPAACPFRGGSQSTPRRPGQGPGRTAWPSVTNSGPMEARSSLPKQSAAIRISMRSTTGQNLCVQ